MLFNLLEVSSGAVETTAAEAVTEQVGVYKSLFEGWSKDVTLFGNYKIFMDIPRTLVISLIGFVVVVIMLGFIALFVKALGKGFDAASSRKKVVPATAGEPLAAVPVPAAAAPAGIPLPPNMSEGSVKLTDVSEADAAVIMAIVSNKTGIPLNRLQFNSIKLIPEDKSK